MENFVWTLRTAGMWNFIKLIFMIVSKKLKGLEMFLIIIIKDTGGLYRENGKTLKTLKKPQ